MGIASVTSAVVFKGGQSSRTQRYQSFLWILTLEQIFLPWDQDLIWHFTLHRRNDLSEDENRGFRKHLRWQRDLGIRNEGMFWKGKQYWFCHLRAFVRALEGHQERFPLNNWIHRNHNQSTRGKLEALDDSISNSKHPLILLVVHH